MWYRASVRLGTGLRVSIYLWANSDENAFEFMSSNPDINNTPIGDIKLFRIKGLPQFEKMALLLDWNKKLNAARKMVKILKNTEEYPDDEIESNL